MRGKGGAAVQLIDVLTQSRQCVKLVSTTPVYEELSNPNCLTVVCKRGSADTVRHWRELECSLRHTQGD